MNLIGQLTKMLSTGQLSEVAQSVGESESSVNKAFSSIFPLLLGALLKKTKESDAASSMESIVGLFKQAPSADEITNQSSGLTPLLKGKMGLAEKFLPSVLGSQAQGLTAVISKLAGIKLSSAGSLLTMAVPMMMGGINKFLGGAPTASQLTSLLHSQKNNITRELPVGLGNVFGLTNLEGNGLQKMAAWRNTWLPKIIVIIVLLLIILFFWKFFSKNNNSAMQTTSDTTTTYMQLAGQQSNPNEQGVVRATRESLGRFYTVKLPNDVELEVPEYGVENKLLTFIKDNTRPIDKANWFSFDRLLFETGSSQLTSDSNEQLKNVAEILKAYPEVTIKIGGYTDNTGTPEVNAKVSQQRADTVRKQLISLGVAEGRIEAEGYGEQHPIAPNDSENNRAKNRRIDLLVTNK